MARQLIHVIAPVLWLVSLHTAYAQSSVCTSVPPPPPNAAASVTSAGSTTIPAVVTVQWVAAPASAPNTAVSYIVEVGDAPGVTNIAEFSTGTTALSTVQPVATGTYYVRVRAVNACGKSAPSPEPVVTVAGSVPAGEPAARRIAGFFSDDGDGYVYVVGEAKGVWGARATPFVKVETTFFGSDGQRVGTGSNYVLGRNRRLSQSRIIDDSSLGAGETACYMIFTDIPMSQVARATSVISWEQFALEPLAGATVLQAIQQNPGSLGEARVEGRVQNAGTVNTYFNEVHIVLRDQESDVMDCDFALVTGSRLQLPTGVVTETALSPGQVGTFVNHHPFYSKDVGRVEAWTSWQEADSAAPSSTPLMTWRTLVLSDLESGAAMDRRGRTARRTTALQRLRALGGGGGDRPAKSTPAANETRR